MFFHNTALLVVVVVGVVLMIIGFGLRDRNPGLVLLGLGFLAVVYASVRKAMEIFGH